LAQLAQPNPSLRFDLLRIASLIERGEKVLDLGCGNGVLLDYLQRQKDVMGRGVEISEEGVLKCVRRGVSVRQGNLEEGLGDYPDQAFDTVILSNTLPYLDHPGFILQEMLRVGRRAIVSFPNWGYWRCRLGLLLSGRLPLPPGAVPDWNGSPRLRPLTIRDFERLCTIHKLHISHRICLCETRRIPEWSNPNLFATFAICALINAMHP
jgi:methionine biosynthesis protein MetW